MKAYYDNKPSQWEAVGNGSYVYRWDIAEVAAEGGRVQWVCEEVVVWSREVNKVTEAVITELWPVSREQKLVNEYNAAKLGVYDEATAKDKVEAYVEFLKARMAVKKEVEGVLA